MPTDMCRICCRVSGERIGGICELCRAKNPAKTAHELGKIWCAKHSQYAHCCSECYPFPVEPVPACPPSSGVSDADLIAEMYNALVSMLQWGICIESKELVRKAIARVQARGEKPDAK